MKSDNSARSRLERRSRLAFRSAARQAGIPADKFRPLSKRTKMADTVGSVLVDDFWFETVLNEQWAVAYRIVAQSSGLAVAEVRVFPNEEQWREGHTAPGEWSGGMLGTRAVVPSGGLTSRVLRKVRLDRNVWYCRELVRKIGRNPGGGNRPGQREHDVTFAAYALVRGGIRTIRSTPVSARGRPSGRPRLAQQEYERLGNECKELLLRDLRGKRLYEKLANRLGLSVSQVKNRLSRGRRYGYFPQLPTRGRSGQPSSV